MFAEVIIPVPVLNHFSYKLVGEQISRAKLGLRVLVEFGKSKIYAGIIYSVSEKANHEGEIKEVLEILDDRPIVSDWQLELWKWISEYYMCSIGEVMQASIPSSFLLKSESLVFLTTNNHLTSDLSQKEQIVIHALNNQKQVYLNDMGAILKVKNVKPIIKKMVDKGILYLGETVSKKYSPKLEKYIALGEGITESRLDEIYEHLEKRAFKQLLVLMKFIELNKSFSGNVIPINKKDLIQKSNSSSAVLNGLIDKGILIEKKTEVSRSKITGAFEEKPKDLSKHQEDALYKIKTQFKKKNTVLLHGLTGSGKTEIYIHLMKECISRGEKVLYLLPEIALTAQLVERLRVHFGDKIALSHSHISSLEKYEIWNDLLFEKHRSYDIVIGARSALFLPTNNLGLIIVDEEHDASFKQFDPAPRYNARDTAMKLADIVGAKVLLGSATPAIETKWLAEAGYIGQVLLTERFGVATMPEIKIVDIKQDVKRKGDSGIFSYRLRDEIKATLERKEQVILFQNRRGYVPYWQCDKCGVNPECVNCDVSLTYHKMKHKLMCHYCGNKYEPPSICNSCGSSDLKMRGIGTEKIEDELQELFPEVRIKRMDHDTTRGKNGHQKIIDVFEKGEIDILVGTQMVTKGLDFDNVSLVGVISADSIVNFPDFRSIERTFQLLTQVSGRAGRKDKPGRVLIQTRRPDMNVLKDVLNNDYDKFYEEEISEREEFNYPPFYRMIKFSIKHSDAHKTDQSARYFSLLLKNKFGERVLGPQPALVARVKRSYIQEIILKIERKASRKIIRENINWALSEFRSEKNWRSVRIIVDIDPI